MFGRGRKLRLLPQHFVGQRVLADLSQRRGDAERAGLGLIDQHIGWYSDPDRALLTIVIADVWKTTPFMALLLLAGLQTIPRSLGEAATIDGASSFQYFLHVRLPLLAPTLAALDRFLISERVELEDVSDAWGLITLAGPSARKTLEGLAGETFPDLPVRHHVALAWQGHAGRVVGNGDTGEEGYDVWLPAAAAAGFRERATRAGACAR